MVVTNFEKQNSGSTKVIPPIIKEKEKEKINLQSKWVSPTVWENKDMQPNSLGSNWKKLVAPNDRTVSWTTWVDTPKTPEQWVIWAIEQWIQSQSDYLSTYDQVIKDKLKTNEDITSQRIDNINAGYDEAKKIYEDMANRAWQNASNKIGDITSAQNTELDMLQRQNELDLKRKQQDAQWLVEDRNQAKIEKEQAIKKAEVEAETNRMVSAINLSRLWLAFSSYALWEYSNAVSAWAQKVATLKNEISKVDAKFDRDKQKLDDDVQQIQQNYIKDSNKVIQTYSDKREKVRDDYESKIDDIQKNMAMNAIDKMKAIDKLVWEYKTEKGNIETDMLKEHKSVMDKTNELTQQYYQKVLDMQKDKKKTLDEEFSSWVLLRLTPEEIARKEDEAWYSRWYIQSKIQQWVSAWIRQTIDKALEPWYPVDIWWMMNEVSWLIQQWYDTNSAISVVTGKFLWNNKDYQYKIQRQQIQDQANADYKDATLWISRANLDMNRQKFEYDMQKDMMKWWVTSTLNMDWLSSLPKTAQDLFYAPEWTVIPTRLKDVSEWNSKVRWKECAEYVNDITGKWLWSDYQSKINACWDGKWVVWDVAVWNPNNGKYWHAWIIIWEQWGYWKVKSSNLKSPWAISVDLIPKNKIASYGNTSLSDTSEYAWQWLDTIKNKALAEWIKNVSSYSWDWAREELIGQITNKQTLDKLNSVDTKYINDSYADEIVSIRNWDNQNAINTIDWIITNLRDIWVKDWKIAEILKSMKLDWLDISTEWEVSFDSTWLDTDKYWQVLKLK